MYQNLGQAAANLTSCKVGQVCLQWIGNTIYYNTAWNCEALTKSKTST